MSHAEREQEATACHHMGGWITGLEDGSLKGLARWYTRIHIKGCSQCRRAFESLSETRSEKQSTSSASDGRENA